jgi:hypothetical protein
MHGQHWELFPMWVTNDDGSPYYTRARARTHTQYEGVIKRFRTESDTKYMLTKINTRSEATQRVMAAKLTRLTHKIAIQLHLVAESCTICSSRSKRLVRKLLNTPFYYWQPPAFFYLSTRWRWMVSFMPRPLYSQGKSPWYSLDRRLYGPQSRLGRGDEQKNSQPLPGLEPPIIQPVAQRYTAELSRLPLINKLSRNYYYY